MTRKIWGKSVTAKRIAALLIPAVVMVLLTGCSSTRSTESVIKSWGSAAELAGEIGHERLEADAVQMLNRWEAAKPAQRPIDPAFWPETIRQLEPIMVYPHMFGVLAVTGLEGRYHVGVYVVTDGPPEEMVDASSGSGLSNDMIVPGLHKTAVKQRQAARPSSQPAD